MGKIRIKTLGSPEEEAKQKEKAKARKEAKKFVKAPGLKGGERLVTMGPSEEELATTPIPPIEEIVKEAVKEASLQVEKKIKARPPKKRGKNYQNAAKLIDKNRAYPLSEAVELVKKTSFTRFDGSVETHITTFEKGISGSVKFPYDTGKKVEIAIANDQILAAIEKGKIDFDVLVATPEFMPKLAKVAKILGPRGLMPNPKAGTVTGEPEKVVEKLKQGETRFKTEAQSPAIHLVVGKTSFANKNLEENLRAVVATIGPAKIKKLTLSSTMGPGIKVNLTLIS